MSREAIWGVVAQCEIRSLIDPLIPTGCAAGSQYPAGFVAPAATISLNMTHAETRARSDRPCARGLSHRVAAREVARSLPPKLHPLKGHDLEQAIGKLGRVKRAAFRCEKAAQRFNRSDVDFRRVHDGGRPVPEDRAAAAPLPAGARRNGASTPAPASDAAAG